MSFVYDWQSAGLDDYVVQLDTAVDEGLAEGAEQIAELARSLAPVGETGALADSITAQQEGEHEWSVTAGNEEVQYAEIVEVGGPHNPATPFMTPASEAGVDIVQTTVATHIGGISGG